jgi:hypothetical protein
VAVDQIALTGTVPEALANAFERLVDLADGVELVG